MSFINPLPEHQRLDEEACRAFFKKFPNAYSCIRGAVRTISEQRLVTLPDFVKEVTKTARRYGVSANCVPSERTFSRFKRGDPNTLRHTPVTLVLILLTVQEVLQ